MSSVLSVNVVKFLCDRCGEWFDDPEIDYELDAFICPYCKSEEIHEKDRDDFFKEQALDNLIDESRGK